MSHVTSLLRRWEWAAVLLLIGCGPVGPEPPPGWVRNNDVRRKVSSVAGEVDAVEFRVFDPAVLYRKYLTQDPAEVKAVVSALAESCLDTSRANPDGFNADAVFDEVWLMGQGRRVATIVIPGDATAYHGAKFGRLYASAAKKAK